MKLIDVSTPKHPNTFTMVDDADFDWLNQWKWYVKGPNGYVTRRQWKDARCRTIYMHVEILKPPPGMKCDHRFGNKLDNRRENLRICTSSENSMNRIPTRGRTLPKGVCWHIRNRHFRAQINVNGIRIHLGTFRTVAEAESARNAGAIKYHGEFARFNTKETPNAQG